NPSYMERIKPYNRADLTTLGLISSHAAYTGGSDWLNQWVEYIDGNHDYPVSFIKANIPSIKLAKPQGTYLAWLDVTEVADRIGAKQMAEDASRQEKGGAKPA